MKLSPSIDALIDALRCLPGVGPKSAQRMTLHLLERDRDGAGVLADALQDALERVGRCGACRNFTELETCELCADPGRDQGLLCIVEAPGDVMALEQTASFRGVYFVLMGHLSPIDGIGPEDLINSLVERVRQDSISEIILATNLTVDGETTAHYVAERLAPTGVKVTRLAHGVPVGGELDYLDDGTLTAALHARRSVGNKSA